MRLCQPSALRIVIWPEASRAQNNMAAVSAEDSKVCVFDPPLKLFMQPFDRIRRADQFPLAFRDACEGEELVARFLQAAATTGHFSRHLRMNALRFASISCFVPE